MGMSIAKKEALLSLVEKLLQNGSKLVLDASALIPEILPKIKGSNCIITPHGGEYMRIFETELKNYNNSNSENEQVWDVFKNAKKYGITIILKGWKNIISNGRATVIERTTPAMTVGGTGMSWLVLWQVFIVNWLLLKLHAQLFILTDLLELSHIKSQDST